LKQKIGQTPRKITAGNYGPFIC